MPVAMAGQIWFSRACGLITSNSKIVLNNRIGYLNVTVPCMGAKQDAKGLINSYKIPEKPKRPLTAYFKFMLEKRPIVLKENPSLHNTEVIKLISEKWKTLSAAEKTKYEEEAMQGKDKYDEEIVRYNAKLTPEQEDILHKIESGKRLDRKKRRVRKESKAEGKPKKPLTSYGLFVQENMTVGKGIGDVMSELKAKWAQMSEVEKQKYQIQYQRNKEKYDIDLAKWEGKMIAEGKHHLVRIATLKKSSLSQTKVKKPKTKTQ